MLYSTIYICASPFTYRLNKELPLVEQRLHNRNENSLLTGNAEVVSLSKQLFNQA